MKEQHPNAIIQCECYLRDASGRSVQDPITEERRRVDTAIIENGRAQTYEITSPNALKQSQIDKENRIIDAGGIYIKDRKTQNLIPINGPSIIYRLP